MNNLYSSLAEGAAEGRRRIAVLVDPDKHDTASLERVINLSEESGIDYFLLGGSLLLHDRMAGSIERMRTLSHIPVILFPGNSLQVNPAADAILLLSVISGRNPDLLIGRHVIAAPMLKNSNLEIIPTGYMLIDGGRPTAVTYMSNTIPIPSHKDDIAVCTAMAGEMLGPKMIYLEAGSGADRPVTPSMISRVKKAVGIPLTVGGGITNPERAKEAFDAGADLIVVGNAIESDPGLIPMLAKTR